MERCRGLLVGRVCVSDSGHHARGRTSLDQLDGPWQFRRDRHHRERAAAGVHHFGEVLDVRQDQMFRILRATSMVGKKRALEVNADEVRAAGFDYIAPTDHQTGYDQEFTWWQNQKLVDLFLQPGRFTPLFAYERSVPFPNGQP